MPKKKDSSITITPDLADMLDRLVVIKGSPDRDTLVRSLLETVAFNQLRKVQDYADRTTLFETEMSMSSRQPAEDEIRHTLRVVLEEKGLPSVARKEVLVQTVFTSAPDNQRKTTHFRFPVAKAARVREHILPWIAEAFTQAEAVHQAEVRANRADAHRKRQSRSTEEKEKEAETRAFYTEKYGREIWAYAVDQANRHAKRAQRRKLPVSFTPEEWILLAERQGFACAECKKPHSEEHLQSHHIRALSQDGSNEISNIILVCGTCHLAIEWRGEDLRDLWYAAELEKAAHYSAGDKVGWDYPVGARMHDVGEVLEVIAPTMGEGPLWCTRTRRDESDDDHYYRREYITDGSWYIHPSYHLLRDDGRDHNGYCPTRLRVRWTDKKGNSREGTLLPSQVSKPQSPLS